MHSLLHEVLTYERQRRWISVSRTWTNVSQGVHITTSLIGLSRISLGTKLRKLCLAAHKLQTDLYCLLHSPHGLEIDHLLQLLHDEKGFRQWLRIMPLANVHIIVEIIKPLLQVSLEKLDMLFVDGCSAEHVVDWVISRQIAQATTVDTAGLVRVSGPTVCMYCGMDLGCRTSLSCDLLSQ
jgi:hypothetical protein